MDIRARLTVLFGVAAALVGSVAISNILHWSVGVVFYIFVLCCALAFVWIEDQTRRSGIIALFETQSTGVLYRRLIHRPAHWPIGWPLCDWALRLAVLYPIATAFFTMSMGYDIQLGSAGSIIEVGPFGSKLLGVALLSVMSFLYWKLTDNSKITNLSIRIFKADSYVGRIASIFFNSVALFIALLATLIVSLALRYYYEIMSPTLYAVSEPNSLVVAVASSEVVLLALSAVLVLSIRHSGFVAFAFIMIFFLLNETFSIFFLLPVLAIVVNTISALASSMTSFPSRPYFFAGLLLFFWLCIFQVNSDALIDATSRSLFLFLCLLPLVNAIFDYFSYLITFSLLRRGYDHPRLAILLGVLDLVIAFILFAISGAGVVVVISLTNHLAGTPIYALQPLINAIRAEPWAYLWVYLMLFSTLVPTFLHFTFATAALGASLPAQWRGWVVANIGAQEPVPATVVPLILGFFATASIVLPVLLVGGGLYLLARVFFPEPFVWYLNLLEAVLLWV